MNDGAPWLPTFLADGSIIQDQPDHLVVAVRVPKATIKANLHLLAALADYAGGDRAIVAPPPASVGKKMRPHYYYAVLLFFAVLSPSPFGDTFKHSAASPLKPPSPVLYDGWSMARPEFKAGEDVDIIARYRRDRGCQTAFDRTIRRAGDNAAVYSSRVFTVPMPATGDNFQQFHLVLHDPRLSPGDYVYSGLTHSECAQGGVYDDPHPQLSFKVVPPQ